MASTTPQDNLVASVSKLSIATGRNPSPVPRQHSKKASPKKKKEVAVADSWEDEEISDSDPTEHEPPTPGCTPDPPPPTPITPNFITEPKLLADAASPPATKGLSDSSPPSRRPEKTDVVARRMIVGALGIKAPKITDEQKAYEKAVKEQEKARKKRQKEEERKKAEEAARAKAAIWDD